MSELTLQDAYSQVAELFLNHSGVSDRLIDVYVFKFSIFFVSLSIRQIVGLKIH